MSVKNLLIASLIASLLTACGGNPASQSAIPGDGTYDDAAATDPYRADGAAVGGDPYTGGDTGVSATGAGGKTPPTTGAGADGQIGNPVGSGFTLKGLVANLEGQPIAGAKVSIGAQTTLTNAKGEFEVAGIMDSQIWVDVTKDGFEAISRYNVTFTAEKPVADKEFKLAPGTAAGGTTTDGSAATGPKLSQTGSFGGPKWKSVSAMAVSGSKVYVLGTIDKTFWFDRAAIVVFDAGSGEEIARIGDKLFSKVPKAASSIKVDGGQVTVSDGSNRVTFDAAGAFVKSTTGGGYETQKVAIDADNGTTYTLKAGNKIVVDSKSFDGELKLADVGNAKSIGCDDEGHLLVLDDSAKTVHEFVLE